MNLENKQVKTYAMLSEVEEETETVKHGILYFFEYDQNDNFYLLIDGNRIEETSTAFNFYQVQS